MPFAECHSSFSCQTQVGFLVLTEYLCSILILLCTLSSLKFICFSCYCIFLVFLSLQDSLSPLFVSFSDLPLNIGVSQGSILSLLVSYILSLANVIHSILLCLTVFYGNDFPNFQSENVYLNCLFKSFRTSSIKLFTSLGNSIISSELMC